MSKFSSVVKAGSSLVPAGLRLSPTTSPAVPAERGDSYCTWLQITSLLLASCSICVLTFHSFPFHGVWSLCVSRGASCQPLLVLSSAHLTVCCSTGCCWPELSDQRADCPLHPSHSQWLHFPSHPSLHEQGPALHRHRPALTAQTENPTKYSSQLTIHVHILLFTLVGKVLLRKNANIQSHHKYFIPSLCRPDNTLSYSVLASRCPLPHVAMSSVPASLLSLGFRWLSSTWEKYSHLFWTRFHQLLGFFCPHPIVPHFKHALNAPSISYQFFFF